MGNRHAIGYHNIIVSGREGNKECREATEEWLRRNCIDYIEFFMCQEVYARPDTVIKKEIYDNHIKDKYNVLFVVDDRKRVLNMWCNECNLFTLDVSQDPYAKIDF